MMKKLAYFSLTLLSFPPTYSQDNTILSLEKLASTIEKNQDIPTKGVVKAKVITTLKDGKVSKVETRLLDIQLDKDHQITPQDKEIHLEQAKKIVQEHAHKTGTLFNAGDYNPIAIGINAAMKAGNNQLKKDIASHNQRINQCLQHHQDSINHFHKEAQKHKERADSEGRALYNTHMNAIFAHMEGRLGCLDIN